MKANHIRIVRGHNRRVSALVYALVDERLCDRNLPQSCISTNAVVQFVLEQQSRMPDYLRFPIRFATMLLSFDAMKNHFGRWHKLTIEQRQSQLSLWRTSKISPFRDFVRLYESLVVLAFESLAINQPVPLEIRFDQIKLGEIPKYPHPAITTRSSEKMKTEIAVVGSGPGGAVTATLLAESGRDVSLIEEGNHYDLESCLPFSAQEMVQKYRCGGLTPAMGAPKVAYVEGRCVGGGSEINSGLYHRTPAEILEKWRREYQVDQLQEEDLIEYFEANENDLTVATIPGKTPESSRKLHEGALSKGWKSQEVPRWFAFDGGVDQEGVPTGHRQSMTKTFIPRFEKAGGRIVARTSVIKCKRVNDHWEIKTIGPDGKPFEIQSSVLFVACGATQSPALMHRSGMGSKPGSTFFMHPTVKLTARFANTINHEVPSVGVHQVKQFSPRLSFGCSIGSKPYLGLGLLDSRQHKTRYLDDHWPNMGIYYAMITGSGRGSVRSIPGFRDPLVRYSLSQKDMADLADGLRKLASILFESGAVELQPSIAGAPAMKCLGDISQIQSHLSRSVANLMTIHLFGSCPMGENKTKCVANSFGAVHGIPNLYLADSSLLCTAPGVNPQGTIMAIVRRNVMQWLEQHP